VDATVVDEVLLSAVAEACVRVGQPDLLLKKLEQLRELGTVSVSGAHTFGSLIKAFGHAKDAKGAWRCWREMRSPYSANEHYNWLHGRSSHDKW